MNCYDDLLGELGIDVVSETDTHLMIMCPFHNNKFTPAATVSKDNGFFYCWGAGCGERCALIKLIQKITGWDHFRSLRFIKKYAVEKPISETLEEIYAQPEDMAIFDQYKIDKWHENLLKDVRAKSYIIGRGINEVSIGHFKLGYDASRDVVITPMYDMYERPVGVIGRSVEGKSFQNSVNLPSRKTLFNYQNARRQSVDSLVIVESNFDCIRAHQAGYPNVVATLSGSFSKYHLSQINKSFNKVIIAVDVDDAGEKFAARIADRCKEYRLQIRRIQYSESERLPHKAKDLSDCTDKEIAQAIRFAVLY